MVYVFQKMAMMFFIVILGYIVGKVHKFDASQRHALSFVVINIALPAMILKGVFSGGELPFKDALTMLLVGSLVWVVLFLIVKVIPLGVRAKGSSKNMYEFMGIFTNNGFMGFPVIETILGAQGLLCAGLLNLPINVFVFSYGIYLLSGGKSINKKQYLKKLINPGIITAIVGILLYFSGIKMPAVPLDIIETLGAIPTPLSLLVLGITLSDFSLKEIFGDYKVYAFSLLKLVIIPVFCLFVMHFIIPNELMRNVLAITIALPPAATVIILSTLIGGDSNEAAKSVFVSTILSVITIPLFSYLLFI